MTNNSPTKEQYIKKDHIIPGQMVSVDNLISWAPGGLYHIRVNSAPSEIFSGGCVFVDHTNDFMSINHQVDIDSIKNVKYKQIFYRKAQSKEVLIKGCHI